MRVDENIEPRWESMLAGIRQQPAWLAHGPRALLERARELLAGPDPPRVYLTGCGDSHYAGLSVRHAFEAWSGIPTQAYQHLHADWARVLRGAEPSLMATPQRRHTARPARHENALLRRFVGRRHRR